MTKTLEKEFHALFRPPPASTERRKDARNRIGKPPKGLAEKGGVLASSSEQGFHPLDHRAFLELRPNPSPFAIFAAIRACIQAAERRSGISDKVAHQKADGDSSVADISDDKKTTQGVLPLPRLVVMGIHGMLDVIRDSCQEHPDLCARALRGLFDTLQGLAPEVMRNEPREAIDKLFSLMLELSSMDEVSPELSSISSGCLISLAIASGETAKLLAAANCLLLTLPDNSAQTRVLPTPLILVGLQRSLHSMLTGAPGRPLPRWFHLGIPPLPTDSFQINLPLELDSGKDSSRRESPCSLASDGRFIYLLQSGALYKISNGFGDSIEGNVLVMNRHLGRSEGVVWVGVVADDLVGVAMESEINGVSANKGSMRKGTYSIVFLDKDTLQVSRRMSLASGMTIPLVNTLFSDGQSVCSILPHEEAFSIQTIFRPLTAAEDSDEPIRATAAPMSAATASEASRTAEMLLKLTKKSMLVYGHGIIADISRSDIASKQLQAQVGAGCGGQPPQSKQHQFASKQASALQQDDSKMPIVLSAVLGAGSESEEADIVACGKDFALVRGAAGTMWAAGRVAALGIKQGSDRWPSMNLSARRVAVGHDGSHAVFLAPDGAVWFAGTARRGEDGDPVKGKRQPKTTKPRKITKLEGVEAVDVACNNGTTAVVTSAGDLLMFGKDAAGHTEPNTGLVAGVKDVMQVCLGKAHVVAVTHSGAVYTFGVNHKGQCARELAAGCSISATGSEVSITTASSADSLVDVEGAVATIGSGDEQGPSGGVSDGSLREVQPVLGGCPPHQFVSQNCRICTGCFQCTGYGSHCIASMSLPPGAQRLPGGQCGCGVGDGGCIHCGLCQVCCTPREDGAPSAVVLLPSPASGQADAPPSAATATAGQVTESIVSGPPAQAAAPFVATASCEQNQRLAAAMNTLAGSGVNALGYPPGEIAAIYRKNQERMRRREEYSPSYSRLVRERERERAVGGEDGGLVCGGRRHHVMKLLNKVARDTPLHKVMVGNDARLASGAILGNGSSCLLGAAAGLRGASGCDSRQDLPSLCGAAGNGPNHSSSGNGAQYIGGPSGHAVMGGGDLDGGKLASLPPVKLNIANKVIQAATGVHHTVLLLENGSVLTFGSNQHGQLGHGTRSLRGAPGPLQGIPSGMRAVQVAAGSNHTVLLLANGAVYTCGNPLNGQLCRSEEDSGITLSSDVLWHAVAGPVPGIGAPQPRRATWVGASGDHTFIRIDENLIDARCLSQARVTGTRHLITLVPDASSGSDYSSLMVQRASGQCRGHFGSHSVGSDNCLVLDHIYDVLWSYKHSSRTVSVYHTVPGLPLPATVPSQSEFEISRQHAALSLVRFVELAASHSQEQLESSAVLPAAASSAGVGTGKSSVAGPAALMARRTFTNNDYLVVNRFENHGGGWGYSGQSIEAIRFMCDADIILGGVGLFGGRGEYTAKLRVLDLGEDGGDQEGDGELLVDLDDQAYECPARQKHPLLLDVPIACQAHRWYLVWARIAGPSSDCGSMGQAMVVTEDQVTFYFKGSKRSNNGTDVTAGQIPQLLYRLACPEAQSGTGISGFTAGSDEEAPVYRLSKDFSTSIDAGCFHSLLTLIEWIWTELQEGPCVIAERLSEPVLSLLRQYVSQVHPHLVTSSSASLEPICRALWLCRKMLKKVLTTGSKGRPALEQFVKESCVTFLHCYQTFYPTDTIKWQGLGELLLQDQKPSEKKHQTGLSALGGATCSSGKQQCRDYSRLLSTILDALSSAPPALLASMLPNQLSKVVLHERAVSLLGNAASSSSPPTSPMSSTFNHQLPSTRSDSSEVPVLYGKLLNDAMSVRDDEDIRILGTLTFADVVDKLIKISVNPLGAILADAASNGSAGSNGYASHNGAANSARPLPADLVHNSCRLLTSIVSEMAARVIAERPSMLDASGGHHVTALNPLVTPSRFQRLQPNRSWNTGNGSPDAICFSVDRAGISIAGAVIYGTSIASHDWVYELDLQDFTAAGPATANELQVERWTLLESVSGTFGPEDCTGEMFEIKFDRAVPIKKNIRYAIRLRNHGSKTNNGDSGVTQVKGPDNTVFTFSDCTLSYNGTNHSRGQIPQILYFNTPQAATASSNTNGPDISDSVHNAARDAASMTLTISQTLVNIAHDYMNKAVQVGTLQDTERLTALESTSLVSLLLPAVFSQLVKIASSDTSAAVRVLNLVKKLLENVVKINKKLEKHREVDCQLDERYYAVVESDHPYKPATISRYRLQFPNDVQWMSLEFDPKCGTAQAEDYLHVYCEAMKDTGDRSGDKDKDFDSYWLVLKRFFGSDNWPTGSIVLPGNSLLFSLESASEYAKDDKNSNFGFRCQVVGHGSSAVLPNSLAHLEKELAYLAGECCSTLLCPEPVFVHGGVKFDSVDVELFRIFPHVLGRGLPLQRCPTIEEALTSTVPIEADCLEKAFLKEFISTKPASSGAKLAMYLQPESFVDPLKCELLYNREELQRGITSSVTVIVKDQYSKLCTVPNLKVEIFAVQLSCVTATIGPPVRYKGDSALGGLLPPTDVPYEATIKDKFIYHAITIMKAYERYSFEELRLMSPLKRQATESLMVSQVGDVFTAHWTPSYVGRYELKALVDGYPVRGPIESDPVIEVRELPQGATLSQPAPQVRNKLQTSSSLSKVRKFNTKDSQGLRVRSAPTLQGRQIGTVPPGGYITFIDAVENDDGLWLRLTPESAQQHCRRLSPSQAHEAWCMQYHNHLGKTLLIPAEDKSSAEDGKNHHHHHINGINGGQESVREQFVRRGPGTYQVIKSGSSGHNIRSRASVRSGNPIGMLVLGNYVTVVEDLVNADGLWLRLSRDSMQHYCATADGEAWTLAQSTALGGGGCTFLVLEGEGSDEAPSETEETTTTTRAEKNSANNSKGFDFSATSQGFFTFGSGTSDHDACSSGSVSPFVFGSLSSTPSTSLHTLNTVSEMGGGHEQSEPGARAPQTTPQPPASSIALSQNHTPDDHSKTVLQRWLKNNEDHIAEVKARDPPAELQGVSVKELVKAIGESRANGNGATPPATPPKTSPTPRRRASSPRAAKMFSEQPATAGHRTPQPVSPQLAKCLQEDLGLAPLAIQRTPSTSPNRSSTSSAPSSSNSSITVATAVRSTSKRISPIEALAPSVAQAVRAVFAAVLWYEGLTPEAIRVTSYITVNSKSNHTVSIDAKASQDPCTTHLRTLWNNVLSNCMLVFNSKSSSDIKDFGASPSDIYHKDRRRRSGNKSRLLVSTAPNMFGNAAVAASSMASSIIGDGLPSNGVCGRTGESSGGTVSLAGSCDMCDITAHPSVTQHMKAAHPGCGGPSGGKGYNSIGNYCGAWSGNCGDGGTETSCWYLLCEACRARYKANDAKRRQSQNTLLSHCSGGVHSGKGLGREILSPIDSSEKQKVVMQNALFVLSLSSPWDNCDTSKGTPNVTVSNTKVGCAPTEDGSPGTASNNSGTTSSATKHPFSVENEFEFASLGSLGGVDEEQARADRTDSQQLIEQFAHDYLSQGAVAELLSTERARHSMPPVVTANNPSAASTPLGPRTFHRSVSISISDWRRNRPSPDSGPPLTLLNAESRLAALATESSRILPIVQFVTIFNADLDTVRSIMIEAVRRLTCRVYALQALRWLLHNVSQATCLHDILWCFVSSLSTNNGPCASGGAATSSISNSLNGGAGGPSASSMAAAASAAVVQAAAPGQAGQQHFVGASSGPIGPGVLQMQDIHGAAAAGPTVVKPAAGLLGQAANRGQDRDRDKEKERGDSKDKEDEGVCLCDHPLESLAFAVSQQTALPLQTAFHNFLESISLLMAHLRTPSPLQQMAVRCWCFRFSPQDHLFLHSSQVFSNISKILSHAEEQPTANQRSQDDSRGVSIQLLRDITSQYEVTTSSRQAMVNSLVDGSTETFWESSDEDRNKTKFIQVKALGSDDAHYVAIHIDNTRDVQNRVGHVSFKVGDESSLTIVRTEEVSNTFAGWVGVETSGKNAAGARVVRVELKGLDQSLRIRQLKVLDKPGPIPDSKGITTPEVIQHGNCEAETLKVFRILTSQVFGKLISGGATTSSSTDGSTDLKEHMVGILFSRSNLTQLQRQVCAHIVATIKKETQRVRDDWELSLSSSSASQLVPQSDAYCFEMLSMVLALSGSSVGRAYLAQQAGLLRDLFSLLHTGSARVQRQVTSLLRRVLPEVSPQVLASILQVPSLPTEDYSIIGLGGEEEQPEPLDLHRPGILDVLLACIAKAITVQIKTKGSGGPSHMGPVTSGPMDQGLKRQASSAVSLATAIHPKDNVGNRWWLRGCSTRKHAQVIIQLIRDMCAGLLTESWACVAKSAIAENIIHLTRLDKRFRANPQECIKIPTLWLCLASLCVLDKEHVERLSSGQWNRKDSQQEKPLCDNHDDGETTAIIQCSDCGNLCCECDRYLHLNHRRTRHHSRQVFKEEEDAIKVDLHEGCGRTKLFWLIALADSNTLKAMVEFREQSAVGGNAAVGSCRFCKAPLTSSTNSALGALGACSSPECIQNARRACTKLHPCGHFCAGVLNEENCLPCLHGCQRKELRQDADDMCMICFSEALCCAPVIMLKCGHIFHRQCTEDVIDRRWPGPRITFNFALCPICKAPIEHTLLRALLQPVWELREDVRRKALMRLEYEGLQANKTLSQHERVSYAMERYAYYVCYKCKKAYFGGEVRCELEAGGAGGGGDDGYDARELVCGACSDVSSAQMCPKHGADFLEYKCRYCCSVAVFFCFGTTHFCNPCHEDFQRVTNVPKIQLPHCPAGPKLKQLEGDECPLHVKHPPTGEEYALGCGVCRNAHTF
ncbi:E3 ubiquitin-protein ligase rpm-1-like isoform X3 [Varroa destructor]|uniref:RCR-type E3 ubiquitin transferase n=1 Tax=Varroa destructor TaxID=109461 RepID=A0A7M7JGG4_VARDE|nr:E3 ubiquitin-protein ligase rpm-1-like isoform X3 [Varroa destructor]